MLAAAHPNEQGGSAEPAERSRAGAPSAVRPGAVGECNASKSGMSRRDTWKMHVPCQMQRDRPP